MSMIKGKKHRQALARYFSPDVESMEGRALLSHGIGHTAIVTTMIESHHPHVPKQVPFRGTVTDQIMLNTSGSTATAVVTGSGHASVIGKFTSFAMYSLDPSYLMDFTQETETLHNLSFTL